MIKKKKAIATLLIFAALLTSACGKVPPNTDITNGSQVSSSSGTPAEIENMDMSFSNRDNESNYTENGATIITFSEDSIDISGIGVTKDENRITITKAGTYILRGSSENTALVVRASDTDKIQIVFDGVSLSNPDGPAVYIACADKVFITLSDGSVNTLSDGNSYEITEDETTLDAALFSREDLTINGNGTLSVSGNYKHGVVSKDDLVITGGNITVTAKNVGLNGKDAVKITNATIDITAGSDGIRSNNTEDTERGFIYIESGNITIEAENDAIQAETALQIDGGSFLLRSEGGSANASTNNDGSWNSGWGGWGGFGGSIGSSSSSSTAESAKGLKAGAALIINGGEFDIDSSDDALHTNGDITITNGTLHISSGDDGIHADDTLLISGGVLDISKSYEGIEATYITISGGNISLVASDDGLNAAGGNDSSAMGGRPGQNMFSQGTGSITISGGYLLVNASGDGVDSNGTLSVTGGVTLVSGPTNSGNGALDYGSSASISGGIFIAVGAQGMATGFTSAENQGAILTSVSTQSAGKTLCICDENGNVLASFTPAKSYQSIVVSAPGIEKGNTYTLVSGAEIEGADENGFAENTTKSGGTTIAEIEMISSIYGSSGGMGGFGDFGGGSRPR